jgi:N-acetyl-gamma-glutamyl-phosphate reductase
MVAGASGFAGALAAHLLYRHPQFELTALTARAEAGETLASVYPRYRVPLVLEELDLERHGDVEAAIVAYPHAASAPVVAALRERGVRVVDLSADFRLRSIETYEEWYAPHPAPQLIEEAAYGLTELHREQIANAGLVANPGCYPTASLLALAPLARAGLIADVVLDAKQGMSGAGRTPSAQTHLSNAAENMFAYKVAGHRHTPEIEEQLALLGVDVAVQFVPHLVPLDQGELVSCYITPTRAVGAGELAELYAAAYAQEPFVEVVASAPGVREMRETNFCRLYPLVAEHTGKILVFSVLDNLWKGTSSQAVQNLNVMFGFAEGSGIS